MAKQERCTKTGFVIKLSTETVQKLTEEKERNKSPVDESISLCIDSESKTTTETIIQSKRDIPKFEIRTPVEEITSIPQPSEQILQSSSSDNPSWGEYAPYISYEGDVAIYTDPTTQQKYTWCISSNSWTPRPTEENNDEVPCRLYTYENDTHIYTDRDGSKFFWDLEKKAWIPKVDDDFLAYYQMSYGFVDNTTKDNTEELNKKTELENKSEVAGIKRKVDPQWFEASDESNTKVYVSNLPLDLTEEEFVDLMQKCGLVMRDLSSQKMKIKLYVDKEQNCFKGDALCTYIKVESVDLALKLLDGYDYKGNKIKVEKAHFQLKGAYNPALKPKKKKKKELEKLKRMQEKLFDWRPEKMLGERSKHERVVIVKNLFHPTDFDKEVQLILDYQQDLREECVKCGEVRKVVIYDRHPEGVAQVTMKEPEEADAVIQLINGRWFGKRQLTAEIWDGRTKYRIAETDTEINKRIDKWEKFLEGTDKDDVGGSKTEGKDDDSKEKMEENVDTSSTVKLNIESKNEKDSFDEKGTTVIETID